MKRSVAFLAAVCLLSVLVTAASAQYSPPPTQPPTQTPPTPQPTDAANDTLKTKAEPKKAPAPATAAADTMSAAAKARRGHITTAGSKRSIILSLGLGSAMNKKPDELHDNFNPSGGGILVIGARQKGIQAALSLNYNFFMAKSTVPNDLNVFMAFLDLTYFPTKSTARPYILVCGGYYRQWIVNLDYTENVLGYGGGAGVEIALDKTRRLFLEGRYVQGRTRQIEPKVNSDMSNSTIIPLRLGVTWEFK
jgi:hypothetical protein